MGNLRLFETKDYDNDEYVDQEVDEVAGMDTSRNRKMFETEEYEVGEPLAHQEGVAGEVAVAQDVGEVGVAGIATIADELDEMYEAGEAHEAGRARDVGEADPEKLRQHQERMKANGPNPPVKQYVDFDDEFVVLTPGVGNLWDAHGIPKENDNDADEVLW